MSTADVNMLIREPNVKRIFVRVRVDGNGLKPELLASADHAHRDLSAIGDKDPFHVLARG
jgi:hypothetical protein